MPDELAQHLPEWAVLIVVVTVAVNYAGRMLAEASEGWAKALGPLGRRWRERGQRRADERRAERSTRLQELADLERERDCFEAKARRFGDRLALLEDGYLVYDAEWHRKVRIRAAELGCKLPEHHGYLAWLRANGRPDPQPEEESEEDR